MFDVGDMVRIKIDYKTIVSKRKYNNKIFTIRSISKDFKGNCVYFVNECAMYFYINELTAIKRNNMEVYQ